MNDDCIFCRIIEGALPASPVFRDDTVMAFMDIQPVTPGHTLVIPIHHAARLSDLDVSTGGRLFEVGQQCAEALYASPLRSEGANFFLADGVAAGQEVFHVHLHVFPRYAGDGFGLRFGADYMDLPPREELDRIADRLRAAWRSV